MNSVREGLRANELTKDTYDRVICEACDRPLKRRDDPDSVWTIRYCVGCETEWKQL